MCLLVKHSSETGKIFYCNLVKEKKKVAEDKYFK